MLAAILVAAGTLFAACTPATDDQTLTASEVAARYGYDESSATLSPIYELVPGYHDPNDGYARDLLAAQCLQGVVEYRAVRPGAQNGPVDERTGQMEFTEQIAAASGYPQLRQSGVTNTAVPADVTITEDISQAMVRCGQQTDARLGTPPERLPTEIEALGWSAVDSSTEVQAATEQWRTCMAPAGVIDLPAGPHDMPPPSISGSSQGAEQGDVSLPLSDREREVAVIDARCRADVKLDELELRARAEAELAAIGANIEGFEATRSDYVEYTKKIDEVITELG